jgi:putative PEP-CTERM system TPR-repeat lipoprotein
MPSLLQPATLSRTLTLALNLAMVLALAGCGKNEPAALARAKATLASKSGDAAKLELTKLVRAYPASGEAHFMLGSQLLADGDADAATVQLQQALDHHFAESAVLPPLAEALILDGKAQTVTSQFGSTVLDDAQGMARLQAAVGHAWLLQGDLLLARTATDRALSTAPQSAPARLMRARLAVSYGDSETALQWLDALLADAPFDDKAWAVKGDLLQRLPGRQAEAVAALTRSIEANPQQTYARAALVTQLLAEHRIDAARAQWAGLHRVAPQHASTALLEARLAIADGQFARARELYQQLLQAWPDDFKLLVAAGENELRLQAALQAEAHLAKASALVPQDASARRLLAQAQVRLGQSQKALLTLAPLVEAADAPGDVLALAALIRTANGEAKAAETLFARLARQKPSDARLRTVITTADLGKRPDTQVLNELRAIAAADPGTAADTALVSALQQRQQIDAALLALEALDRKRPTDPSAPLWRGQLQAALGKPADARHSFEQALGRQVGYFPAVAALAALDLRDRQPEAARKRLADLAQAQPRNVEVRLALADLARSQGAARADIRKLIVAAIKAAPNNPDAHAALVTHHLDGHDLAAALQAAQAAHRALPNSIELLDLLGRCQARSGEIGQALSSYGKIVTLQPKSPRGHLGLVGVYLLTVQLDQAQRSINRALELAPDSAGSVDLAITVARRRGQTDTALTLARQLQARQPDDALGFLRESEIEVDRQQWRSAVSALRQAVGKAKSGAAAPQLHHALLQAGQPDEARAFVRQWTHNQPGDVGFLFYLGHLAQLAGDTRQAEARYQQVLALQPAHALALNNLAMLQLQSDPSGAKALAERAVQLAPDQAALLDTLAQCLAASDQTAEAAKWQKRALALEPGNSSWRLNLARIYLQAGDKALAKSELDRLATLGAGFKQQAEVGRMLASLSRSLPGR